MRSAPGLLSAVRIFCASSAALWVFLAADAWGHGRAIYSVSVAPHASNGQVLVGTTYGILLSDPSGYYWICDEALHYQDLVDPKLLWANDGTMFAALPDSLKRSTDGCDWASVPAFETTGANHVQEDPTSRGTFWVTTGKYGQLNSVSRSSDGQNFAPVLARPATYFTGVAVAPSAPQRVYASAWYNEPLEAWLFRSVDRGANFQQLTPLLPGKSGFKVLAVSPTDANQLFATTYNAQAFALLLRSTDGGDTWVEVLSTDDVIRGLHVTGDGQTVFVAAFRKMYRSTDSGVSFTELPGWSTNACISGRDGELWTCGRQQTVPFALGTFSASDLTVTPRLLRHEDIKGPLSCPAGTPVGDVCPGRWPLTAPLLNIAIQPRDAGQASEPNSEPAGSASSGCGCGAAPSIQVGTLSVLLLLRVRRRRCSVCLGR